MGWPTRCASAARTGATTTRLPAKADLSHGARNSCSCSKVIQLWRRPPQVGAGAAVAAEQRWRNPCCSRETVAWPTPSAAAVWSSVAPSNAGSNTARRLKSKCYPGRGYVDSKVLLPGLLPIWNRRKHAGPTPSCRPRSVSWRGWLLARGRCVHQASRPRRIAAITLSSRSTWAPSAKGSSRALSVCSSAFLPALTCALAGTRS